MIVEIIRIASGHGLKSEEVLISWVVLQLVSLYSDTSCEDHLLIKTAFYRSPGTVNSLMFVRDLFGEFRDRF